MRSPALCALLLAAAASGCGGTRLFSRAADQDDLDRPSSEAALTAEDADAGASRRKSADPVADRNLIRPARVALPISEHLDRAEQALAAQHLSEADEHLKAIVQYQPTHPRAHHLLAVIADLEGRFGDAEHHYLTALQSDRNNASIVGDLGYSYLLQNEYSLAEQYLRQARALDPSHVNAAHNLALLYSRRQDLEGAYLALADVLRPAEIAPTLAQMFPGLTPEAFAAVASRSAGGPALQRQPMVPAAPSTEFASVQSPSGALRGVDPFAQLPTTASGYQTAPSQQSSRMVPPQFASAIPNAAPEFASAMPNAAAPAGAYAAGRPAVPPPYAAQSLNSTPLLNSGIEQASAAYASEAPALPARAPRRWPPAAWPSPAAPSAPPVIEQAAGAASRPSSGVTYLMQRRPSEASGPTSAGAVPPAGDPFRDPPSGRFGSAQAPATRNPYTPPATIEPQAQYSSGPGSSRIVTWSNHNGQSLDAPPLPPMAGAPQSFDGAGPISTSAPPIPQALRTSPGAASGWNGGAYPSPQRQLPGTAPTIFDTPPQGIPAPTRPGAPFPHSAVTTQAPPHAGFTIAPANEPPVDPLATYENERRQTDQYLQQQVEQTYARSPAGYIPPPSANMPRPIHEVPTYQPQTGYGAPLSSSGTPWPARAAEVPGQGAAPVPGPAGPPASAYAAAAPPAYRAAASGTPVINPGYGGVAPQADQVPYYGPAILPGR